MEHYKTWIRNELAEAAEEIEVPGWSYENDDIDEMKNVLTELSAYFKAGLDIDKMMKQLKTGEHKRYFITIAILPVALLFADPGQ